MQLGWVPPPGGHHGHHGGHRGGGFFPGWWGTDGWLDRGPQTTVYEVQQDNTPLYLIGGAALIGLLILSRR